MLESTGWTLVPIVPTPEMREAIRGSTISFLHETATTRWIRALSVAPEPPADLIYPLPDSLYPTSKDWVEGDYSSRVAWLHAMYESKRKEADLAWGLVEEAMSQLRNLRKS